MTVKALVKFTYSGTVIYIDTTNVKENFTNSVKVITTPSTEDSPNTSKLINLNKVEKRITVTGTLSHGQYSGETYTDAKDKKEGLKTIFGKGNVVVLTYEGIDYDVAVDKYEMDYKVKDEGSANPEEVVIYDVIISAVIGEDIV